MTDSDTDANDRAQRIATSIRDRMRERDSDQSRRNFMRNSAIAGGTLLALGGGTGIALAQEDEEAGDGAATGAAFDDVAGTDVDVLNYALTLEHLEDVFYREAIEQFSEDDFVQADALSELPEATRQDAWEYVQVVGEHEATHVDVLTQAVTLLGGEPASEGSYDFGVETVGDFVALGAVFENTGVAAYAGAAPFIESPDLLGSALAIHSVEARHAAVLNTLNGDSPFPNAFDSAASQAEVLEAVSDFIGDSTDQSTPTPTPGGEGSDGGAGNQTQN